VVVDRRGFLWRASLLLAVVAVRPTLPGVGVLAYREIALDGRVSPDDAQRIFAKELEAARRRHPVYVLYYQAESPHRASYRKAVDAVLRKKGYRGTVISVDIDRHADLAENNFFDVNGRPYTIAASLAAFVDGKLMSSYKTSIRSEIDGTAFSLSYPGIAGVTAGPLGDDVEKLASRIAGFVDRADQALAEPAR
jgi:hypothetical protein